MVVIWYTYLDWIAENVLDRPQTVILPIQIANSVSAAILLQRIRLLLLFLGNHQTALMLWLLGGRLLVALVGVDHHDLLVCCRSGAGLLMWRRLRLLFCSRQWRLTLNIGRVGLVDLPDLIASYISAIRAVVRLCADCVWLEMWVVVLILYRWTRGAIATQRCAVTTTFTLARSNCSTNPSSWLAAVGCITLYMRFELSHCLHHTVFCATNCS